MKEIRVRFSRGGCIPNGKNGQNLVRDRIRKYTWRYSWGKKRGIDVPEECLQT